MRQDESPWPEAADDGSEVFSFDWTIPAHNALVLKAFSCPESMPLVAAGRRRSQPGKPGRHRRNGGELDAKAGSGTGYAGFDRANTKFYKGGINEWRNMTGWPKGDFFFNSIWAPLLNAGHFSLKVTCRNGSGTEVARLLDYGADSNYNKDFFPWKW